MSDIQISKTLMFKAYNDRPRIICEQQCVGCCDTYLNHTTPSSSLSVLHSNMTVINGSAFAYWFDGLSIENCHLCAVNTSVYFNNMTLNYSGFTMFPGYNDFYEFNYVGFQNSQISIVSSCLYDELNNKSMSHPPNKNVNLKIKNSQLTGWGSTFHTSDPVDSTQTLTNIDISLENIQISNLNTGIIFSNFENLHLKMDNLTMQTISTQDYCLVVIAVKSKAHINISNSRFEKNTCSFGGAFYLNTSDPEHIEVDITNTVLVENQADQGGSAVKFGLGGDASLQHVTITNSTFDSNVNFETAAGIYLEAGTLEVTSCTFLNNKVNTGRTIFGRNWNRKGSGGAIYVGDTATISITNCTFLNNSANWFGGTILSSGDLTISDSYFENSVQTGQAALGDVLYLSGPTHIDNITIYIKKTYSNNPIFWYSSDHLYNITGLYGGFIDIQCPQGARIHNETLTEGTDGNFTYRDLFYMCNPCPSDTYSLQVGYVRGTLRSGELDMPSQFECIPCEYGGTCTDGQIHAKVNFWGYAHSDVPKVSFVACPGGYCCNNTSCDSYDACNSQREGVLCGQCQQGTSEHLFTTKCIPNEQCDEQWFLLLDLIMCCLYVAFFLFYIEVTVFLMQTLFKIEVTADDQVSTRAYVKILFYFYQTVGQLTMPEDLASKKTGMALEPFISYLLTFQPIYGLFGACPFKDMTPVKKIVFNTMPTLGFFVLLGLLTITVYIQRYRQSKVQKTEMVTIATRITASPKPNLKSRLASAFVNYFLFNYINISNMTFLLLACIPLHDKSVLYIDGNVTCVAPWQSIFILLAIIHVFPFFLTVIVSRDLLERGTINLTQFFLSYFFPLPLLVYWAFLELRMQYITKRSRNNSIHETAEYHSFANHPNHETDRIKCEILFVVETPYIKHNDPENCVLYWEGVLILRRLRIVVFGTFIVNRLLSVTLQMSMCIIFLLWHVHKQPFCSTRANKVETASLTILSFISLSHVIKATLFTAGKVAEGPNEVQIMIMSWMEWTVINVPPILVVIILIGTIIYRFVKGIFICIHRNSRNQQTEPKHE